MTPLAIWVIVGASSAVGVALGILFERLRGSAARRAARFEAELVQARSELMRYQEQTKQHFGKSAELLGRMATDYREFLDHFVSGAEELCGPNMKELNARGLDRPLLDGTTQAPAGTAGATTLPHAATTPAPPLDADPLAEDVVTK